MQGKKDLKIMIEFNKFECFSAMIAHILCDFLSNGFTIPTFNLDLSACITIIYVEQLFAPNLSETMSFINVSTSGSKTVTVLKVHFQTLLGEFNREDINQDIFQEIDKLVDELDGENEVQDHDQNKSDELDLQIQDSDDDGEPAPLKIVEQEESNKENASDTDGDTLEFEIDIDAIKAKAKAKTPPKPSLTTFPNITICDMTKTWRQKIREDLAKQEAIAEAAEKNKNSKVLVDTSMKNFKSAVRINHSSTSGNNEAEKTLNPLTGKLEPSVIKVIGTKASNQDKTEIIEIDVDEPAPAPVPVLKSPVEDKIRMLQKEITRTAKAIRKEKRMLRKIQAENDLLDKAEEANRRQNPTPNPDGSVDLAAAFNAVRTVRNSIDEYLNESQPEPEVDNDVKKTSPNLKQVPSNIRVTSMSDKKIKKIPLRSRTDKPMLIPFDDNEIEMISDIKEVKKLRKTQNSVPPKPISPKPEQVFTVDEVKVEKEEFASPPKLSPIKIAKSPDNVFTIKSPGSDSKSSPTSVKRKRIRRSMDLLASFSAPLPKSDGSGNKMTPENPQKSTENPGKSAPPRRKSTSTTDDSTFRGSIKRSRSIEIPAVSTENTENNRSRTGRKRTPKRHFAIDESVDPEGLDIEAMQSYDFGEAETGNEAPVSGQNNPLPPEEFPDLPDQLMNPSMQLTVEGENK